MRKTNYLIIILVSFFITLKQGWAIDELMLSGYIKEYHEKDSIIKIDVQNGSCKGVRTFKLNKNLLKHNIKIDNFYHFMINSSFCENDKIYEIISIDEIGEEK